MTAHRPRRPGERGLTVIELLVTLSILALIGGAVAVSLSIGIRTLGNGGASDRIAGTHDLSSFEQQLGGDIAHAACISKSPASSANSLGTCTTLLGGTPAACGSASTSFLCVAWPVWTAGTCHTAVYSQSGGVVTRAEFSGASRLTTIHVSTDSVTATANLTTTPSPSNPSKNWVSLVSVTVTSLAIPAAKSPPSGTFRLHPVAMDPTTATVTPLC